MAKHLAGRDIYTIKEFRDDVKAGYLIGYDGSGVLADKNGEEIRTTEGKLVGVECSDDMRYWKGLLKEFPQGATVSWYNR